MLFIALSGVSMAVHADVEKAPTPAIENYQRFIGRELDVLIEEKDNEVFIGRTQFDAYEVDGVVFIKKKGLKLGDFCRTKIVDSYDYDLVGI